MKKIIISVFFTVLIVISLCSCWKMVDDYGPSTWRTAETDEIQIELTVLEDGAMYSLVTYKGVTKKYRNYFTSEMIHFCNIDENGEYIRVDGGKIGFAAFVDDASKNGVVTFSMNMKGFIHRFSDGEEEGEDQTYVFNLYKCE